MYAVLYALLFEILLDPGSTNQCTFYVLVAYDSVTYPNVSIILGDHLVGKKLVLKVTPPWDAIVKFCSVLFEVFK